SVITFINKIIKLFGGSGIKTIPPLPTNPFGLNTVGVMYLSNHITSNPKLFISGNKTTVWNVLFSFTQPNPVTGYTIDPNNKGKVNVNLPNLSARSLVKYFHYSNLISTFYPPAY